MAAPYPSSSPSLPTNLSMSTPESSPQGTKEYCHSNLSSFPLYSKHISACISVCAKKDVQTDTTWPRGLRVPIRWPRSSSRSPRTLRLHITLASDTRAVPLSHRHLLGHPPGPAGWPDHCTARETEARRDLARIPQIW